MPTERTMDDERADAGSDDALIGSAIAVRERAYAPYSGYRVGAALLTGSGRTHAAPNIENASYGLTVCAERAAVIKAVSEGETDLRVLAVVTEDGAPPCGACRQFLAEFGTDLRILIADTAGNLRETSLAALLPDAFDLPDGD
jgi:cytidine deaminase